MLPPSECISLQRQNCLAHPHRGHLAYKALSSFLFVSSFIIAAAFRLTTQLRLINPALLRPHLFCLHTGELFLRALRRR
jgi:hypothetical protein